MYENIPASLLPLTKKLTKTKKFSSSNTSCEFFRKKGNKFCLYWLTEMTLLFIELVLKSYFFHDLKPTLCLFQIYIDGPFGAPASNIFRAEHAVLVHFDFLRTN